MPEESFKTFVLDQLAPLKRVACRAMFGGHGLYRGEVFFGILFNGRLYFKTDFASRPAYRERGMQAFRPSASMTLKTYYEVPVEILEDAEEFLRWARRAIDSQMQGKSKGKREKPKPQFKR